MALPDMEHILQTDEDWRRDQKIFEKLKQLVALGELLHADLVDIETAIKEQSSGD